MILKPTTDTFIIIHIVIVTIVQYKHTVCVCVYIYRVYIYQCSLGMCLMVWKIQSILVLQPP